jgi:hypothetical protein
MIVFDSSTPKITITPATDITGVLTLAGGLAFTGTSVTAIDLSGITPQIGAGKFLLGIGKRGTPKSVTVTTDRYEPIQLVVTSAANPTGVQTVNLIYANLDTGAPQANSRLKVADWTIGVNHALQDAYVTQMELDQSGAGAVTGQMCTLSATMQIGGTAVIGECQALYVSVGGAGVFTSAEFTAAKIGIAQTGLKAKAVIEAGCAAFASSEALLLVDGEGQMDSLIKVSMGSGSGITNLVEFVADATKDCLVAGGAGTCTFGVGQWRKIRVDIAGDTYYIPCSQAISNA